MNIPFAKYSKFYYLLSGILALTAIVLLVRFGLKFGIDFTGGTIWELEFEKRPDNPQIEEKLAKFNLGEKIIQPTEERGVIFKFKEIDENTHQEILSSLGEISKVEEKRFESIGPTIGLELRQKALILIMISLLCMLLYITVAFKGIGRPISSFQYGLISVATLGFDILIPIGLFSYLGNFHNIQVTVPIIAALLTVLGYTMNDKIVVFDRIRENLIRGRGKNFEELVNRSLNEILSRSLTTGSCSIFMLLSIFLFGGITLKYFALALILGILTGTYSSLFLASPLLISWLKWKERKFIHEVVRNTQTGRSQKL